MTLGKAKCSYCSLVPIRGVVTCYLRDKLETAVRQKACIWRFMCIIAVNGVNSSEVQAKANMTPAGVLTFGWNHDADKGEQENGMQDSLYRGREYWFYE